MSRSDSFSFRFRCSCCGEQHEGMPAFGANAPDAYHALPESVQAERAELSSDQCVIDEQHFFVRGCIEIPVAGHQDRFEYGVWVSLSAESFAEMSALWDVDGRERQARPYFGWLNTRLAGYPDTLNLKTRVHTRARGLRPLVELEPTDHPLAVEQRAGIDEARLTALLELNLHPWPPEPCRPVLRAHRQHLGGEDNAIVFDSTGRAPESAPPLRRIDVWIWRANDECDVTTFVTIGMSARALPLGASHRAELHLAIRAELSPDDEQRVAGFLANAACYPWTANQVVDFWHTVPSTIAIPVFPSCSAFLLRPAFTDSGLDCVKTDQGEVHVLHLVPMTAQEHALARQSVSTLLDHWHDKDIDVLVDRDA